jgi:hypothetical protein
MLNRIHRIFLDFFHRPVFQKTRRFGNWICFRPQVKVVEKTPTQLGDGKSPEKFCEYRVLFTSRVKRKEREAG